MKLFALSFLVISWSTLPQAHGLGVHQHDVLHLTIAAEHKELYLEVQGPAETLLGPGAEAKDATAAVQERLLKLKKAWRDPLKTFFQLGMSCQGAAVESEWVGEEHEPLDHHHHQEHQEHAAKKKHQHAEEQGGEHRDLRLSVKLSCERSLAGETLKTRLFSSWPGLKKVELRFFPVKGQPQTLELNDDQRALTL